ncbi:uncharacterized protein SAMN04515667_1133 [Formosa sp. Hel1_31_208]|nr:uncharacterized protein SAMN04515667_1133 [Formosa sp. Hel1_31_208]
MKKLILIGFVILCFSCKSDTGIPVDYSTLPKNENNQVLLDLSHIFYDAQIDSLSAKIIAYENQSTNEIVILTVDSIAPFEDLHIYSSAIGNYWGVGKKDKNNGLVIVFLKTQRRIWLSTGDGATKVLTDSICQKIIDQRMIPYFKEGNYYLGLDKGLDAIINAWH